MKKILLFLIVILTILLPTTTIHAKEVRYDIASYKGHLIIDNDGNGSLHPGSTICVFNSDYNGQYVTLGYADPVPTFDKTGLGEESRHLKFKNMVQAIILDLIDRGYIAYSQENGVDTLRRISKEGSADYEFDFLEMLFDDRIEITDREMFSRYYLDEKGLRKQFNNAKSNYERDSVREEGQRIRRKFVKDGRSVTEGVNREISSLGLPNLY